MQAPDFSRQAIADFMAYLTPAEAAEMDRVLRGAARFWYPQTGPQMEAFHSPADVVGFGGAAGGGKTDLLIGLAAEAATKALFLRRESAQNDDNADRLRSLVGTAGKWNGQRRELRLPINRSVVFGGCKVIGEEAKFKGRPRDHILFDEATEFAESQFRFLPVVLRAEGMRRTRIVAAFNPPMTEEGMWVLQYWAPWLDETHPYPALPGELRWFISDENGKDEEVDGPTPVNVGGKRVKPVSRTFIFSLLKDNRYYADGNYETTLLALPEPMRSQMLRGDFKAGIQESAWQLIPRAWVIAAQARWTALPPARDDGTPEPLIAMGVDVARGGKDRTVIACRHGKWFAPLECHAGSSTPDGGRVAALIIKHWKPGVQVNIDVIGVGGSVVDHIKGASVKIGDKAMQLRPTPLNGSEKSDAHDKATGILKFANKRAEWWWGLREALDPEKGERLMLPPDNELLADLTAPRWSMGASGILIEAKDDIVKRLKRSPDKGDSVAYAWANVGRALPRVTIF